MSLLVRLVLSTLTVSLWTGAAAQTGRYSHGHSKYHHAYKGLRGRLEKGSNWR